MRHSGCKSIQAAVVAPSRPLLAISGTTCTRAHIAKGRFNYGAPPLGGGRNSTKAAIRALPTEWQVTHSQRTFNLSDREPQLFVSAYDQRVLYIEFPLMLNVTLKQGRLSIKIRQTQIKRL